MKVYNNLPVTEAKFKVLASFNNYDLIENPTKKDMIILKNGKTVGKLTKISKYIKDDIKLFIKMVESGKLGQLAYLYGTMYNTNLNDLKKQINKLLK